MGTALALVKFGLALAAAAVLAREILRGETSRWTVRWLTVCAVLAGAAFFAPALTRGSFVHRWEMFHYYLGAKYHAELGYERLYACVALADDADGIRNVRTRRMRDLRTDGLTTPAATLADPGLCHDHFSTARWTEFAGDVREFRRATKARRHWENMQRDHGYNPPPVWTLIGRSLASLAPPTPAFLGFLASLDLALIAAALALLGWAFGARIALTAAIFWATQAPSDFGWTGGGFLRQDWLFCVIAALALLRKRRPALAGAALATAALLRLFPALLFVGPLAVALGTLLLRPRASFQFEGRFFAGAAAALLLLGAASVYGVGGSAYPAFWEHIQLRHTSAITNHMSLRTLFAFAPDARIVDLVEPGRFDPGAAWVEARAQRLEEVGGLYRLASAALVLATLLVGLRLRTSWAGLAVSVPLIAALTDPSCYYYSIWVVTLVLGRLRRGLAVTLLGVAAAGQLLGIGIRADEEQFFALAALYVLSGLVLVVSFVESPARTWHRLRKGISTRRAPSLST